MDEELAIRVDTEGFRREVAAMRALLVGTMGDGAERAGRSIEGSLGRSITQVALGFRDLRSVALKVLGEIAAMAVSAGLRELLGSGGGPTRVPTVPGPGGSLAGLLAGLLGSPGRATGGPVAPGRPYVVGERGRELFVPTAAGRVEPLAAAAGPREVRVAITVRADAGEAAGALRQSSRQVAQTVRAALLAE